MPQVQVGKPNTTSLNNHASSKEKGGSSRERDNRGKAKCNVQLWNNSTTRPMIFTCIIFLKTGTPKRPSDKFKFKQFLPFYTRLWGRNFNSAFLSCSAPRLCAIFTRYFFHKVTGVWDKDWKRHNFLTTDWVREGAGIHLGQLIICFHGFCCHGRDVS